MSNFTSLLLKGTLWKFLFYASSYIINLYIAHQLKAGEAGNFYYLINNLSIVIFFLGFGIDSAINFFNAGKKFTSNTLLSIGLLWCLLGSIIFSIAYVFLVSAKVVQPHIPFFYLAFFVLGALLSAMVSALFFSSNDAATPNYVPTLFNILLFTILFILKENITPAYLLMTAMPGVCLLIMYMTKSNFSFTFKRLPWNKIILYGWFAFLSNIFITLLLRADYWLVKALTSADNLGNYIMTSKFSQLIILLPSLVSFMLFPLITQRVGNKKDTKEKIVRLTALFFYQSLALCILIASIGYWLFPFLYGPSFNKMFLTFVLLIPGMLSLSATYPIAPYFSGIDANKILVKNAFLGMFVMVISDLFLIPRYSLYGAAMGSSLGYMVYFLTLFSDFKKHFDLKFFHLFNFRFVYTTYLTTINLYKSKLLQ